MNDMETHSIYAKCTCIRYERCGQKRRPCDKIHKATKVCVPTTPSVCGRTGSSIKYENWESTHSFSMYQHNVSVHLISLCTNTMYQFILYLCVPHTQYISSYYISLYQHNVSVHLISICTNTMNQFILYLCVPTQRISSSYLYLYQHNV